MAERTLLDWMVPPRKPNWRGGTSLCGSADGYVPPEDGDLQWFAHDWRDHRQGGRWFRFDACERIWRCLDPFDTTDINAHPDTPPAIDRHGRLV